MKANECARLENDKDFKLTYLKQTKWWLNFLFIAPTCILFLGLFGLVYLLKYGMLVSYYTIPFLVFFVLGTIWLKGVKRHVLKTKIADNDAFRLCQAKMFAEKGGYIYVIFTTGDKRHNDYYISNMAKDMSLESISESDLSKSKKHLVPIQNDQDDEKLYLKTLVGSNLNRRNVTWRDDSCIPVFLIDDKNFFIVRKRDMD